MTHFFLYLFLAGQSPIAVPGHFDTLEACERAGDWEVARFKLIHSHSPAYPWCIEGGIDDLEYPHDRARGSPIGPDAP